MDMLEKIRSIFSPLMWEGRQWQQLQQRLLRSQFFLVHFAGIMAASRFLAMARDNLLPAFFEDVHSRYDTPHWAIVSTGLSMAAAIMFLPVHDVAEFASGFNIMIFIVINACVLVLRSSSKSHWYEPEWKSPLYPLMQILGILGGSILIYAMGMKAVIGGTAAIIIGIIIYQSYGKKHTENLITPGKHSV